MLLLVVVLFIVVVVVVAVAVVVYRCWLFVFVGTCWYCNGDNGGRGGGVDVMVAVLAVAFVFEHHRTMATMTPMNMQ